MIIQYILLLLCTFSVLHADHSSKASSYQTLTAETAPNSFVNNVNTIFGTLLLSSVDIVQHGPHPLHLQRYYNSDRCLGLWLGKGMSINYPLWIQGLPGTNCCYMIAEDEGGSVISYTSEWNGKDSNVKYYLDPGVIFGGLVNTARGEISGRTNVKNNLFVFKENSSEEFIRGTWKATLSDGSEREYSSGDFDSPMNLKREKKSSGNRLYYSYHRNGYLEEISTYSHDEKRKFGSLYFDFEKNKKKIKVTSSNGKSVIYSYSFMGKDPATHFPLPYIDTIESSDQPLTKYSYSDRNEKKGGRMIAEIRKPHGRYLKLEYDDKGRVIKQKAPSGAHGKEVTLYTFEYKTDKNHTNVVDGLGRKSVYRYSSDKRLTSRTKYDANESLARGERFIWGEDNKVRLGARDKSDEGCLLAKTVFDGSEKTRSVICYSYDSEGNILKESLYGNLSGKGKINIYVDKHGRPNADVEHYSKHYTYSDDEFRLRLTETENDGPKITYRYVKGTDLVSARFIQDGDTVIQREFFEYDDDAVMIRKIVQDGPSHDPDNLRGVTYRRITKITPIRGCSGHGIGQPEKISEYYYDPISKEEILLGKKHFVYNRAGQVEEEKVFDAHAHQRYTIYSTYNDSGLLTSKTDAIGRKTVFKYDDNFNKVREELIGSGFFVTYAYDTADRLIEEIEHHTDNQHVKKYSYDVMGNMISSQDRFGQTTSYEYDGLDQPIKITYPIGSVTKRYDLFGNVKTETNQNGHTTTIRSTIRNKPYFIKHSDGSEEHFEYNLGGTLALHIDRTGTRTLYTYDILGRVVQIKKCDSHSNTLTRSSSEYNAFHITSTTDPMGHTTHFSYDGAGRLIEQKKRSGSISERTTYHYDELGRLHTTKKWINDSKYIATIQERDLLDRVIKEYQETETGTLLSKKRYTYTLLGEISKESSYIDVDTSTSIQTEYNSEGLPVRVIDPQGNETTIAYTYKKVFQKSTTDPMGVKTVETHDVLGRTVSLEKFSPSRTLIAKSEFSYDPKGNKTLDTEYVISGGTILRTYTIAYTYTKLDQVASVTEESKKTTKYTYTLNGLLQKIIKPDGKVVSHAYDALSRLIRLTSSDGSIEYEYLYDKNNNPLRVIDKKNRLIHSYAYDAWNRRINDSGCKLSYDTLGCLDRYQVKSGPIIDYQYTHGRLKHIVRKDKSDHELYRHSYTSFDLESKVTSTKLIGGLGTAHFEWDKLGRNIKIKTPYWSENLSRFDLACNLLESSYTDAIGNVTSTYTYDDLYQLTSESGAFDGSFKNDSINNRLKKNKNSYQLNSLNQLQSDSETGFTYDKNGNPIEIRSATDHILLTYDALDRLTSITRPESVRCEYLYDSFHRRFQKRVFSWNRSSQSWKKASFFHFLYLNNREVGVMDESGKLIEFRVLGLGKGAELGASIAIELDSTLYCPIHDHRGNITTLVDVASQEIAETYRFSAFGEESIFDQNCQQVDHSQVNNPWRFSSKRFDSETGFIFFGRRYYSPSIGRFLTCDPLGFADGPNLYAYVHNQPLILIDPYGLTAEENAWAATSGIGQGIANGFFNPLETLERNFDSFKDLGGNILKGDFSSYKQAYNNSSTSELIHASALRITETGVAVAQVCGLVRIAAGATKIAYHAGRTVVSAGTRWIARRTAAVEAGAAASNQIAKTVATEVSTNAIVKEPFKLNRFHEAARNLSEAGQQNIRTLRGWAKSKGYERLPNPTGAPEKWGTYTNGEFKWNLILKPERSMREGLASGSNIPRFDAKIADGKYTNPFNGQIGGKDVGTHLPFEKIYK